MTARKKTAIHGPPLTIREDTGITMTKVTGRPLTCHMCGKGTGTLVKINEDKYKHTNC